MLPTRQRLAGIASSSILLMACGGLLLAEASGPEVQLRKDYALEWAGYLSLVSVIAAVGLIGYVLLFRRRHLASAPSQWMLFIGICIMPLPMMLLGSAVGLEQAKDVSFCQHCHVMRQFVSDMKDPAGDGLAAVHFKNRYIQRSHCYVCHTDYGLFGTMEAKLAGLAHIWKETTGSFTLPVRIARPYQFMICLDCHAQSAKYDRVPEHKDLVARVAGGEVGCTSCHGSSHLPPEQRGVSR